MEKKQYKVMYEVEDTHFWYRGMRTISDVLLNKFLLRKRNNIILDAGCGTGASLIALKKYGNTQGFDISPEAVRLCKKRGLKNVSVGSIDRIPNKKELFDLITCFDVLGQMEVESDRKAMKEFHRVLKKKGILLIRIAAYNWLYGYHDRAVHTKHRYNKKELNTLLTQNGFKVLQVTYANTFLFPVAFFVRLLKRILPLKESGTDSDVTPVHPLLNTILFYPLTFEAFLMRYLNLPFGLSVIAVAIKK